MYCTIRTILRYDTIHTIHTLYRMIHKHLRYADTIRNFLHIIQYVSYDTDNYDFNRYLLACIYGLIHNFTQLAFCMKAGRLVHKIIKISHRIFIEH